MNYVFLKNCSFKFFSSSNFLNFLLTSSKKWINWSKAKLISLYRVDLFTSIPILIHIEWNLWISIKVSYRLGKHLSNCFLILLFFLQFAKLNLKAPPYSKTLHYLRISISRALPPCKSISNRDCKNSSRGNVSLIKCKILTFYLIFFYKWSRYY